MLVVFHVGLGQVLHFNPELWFDTVVELKEAIFRNHGIPTEYQVVLVSGGEILQPKINLATFAGCGTEENPFFLFSLAPADVRIQKSQGLSDLSTQWEKRVRVSECEPPSLETLSSRASLSQQLYECGMQEVKNFESLVREQHMQQQGWCAVVANLDDTTKDFQARSDEFYRFYEEHIKRSEQYRTYLATFNDDLDRLSQIKILPGLMQYAELKPFCAFDDVYKDKQLNIYDKSQSNDGSISESLSLLEWILAKNTRQILHLMAQNCQTELDRFNKEILEDRQIQVKKIIDDANQIQIREIPGLSKRLQGLDKLGQEAHASSVSQHNVMISIQNNWSNLSNKNDQYSSVIPDLCQTTKTHLVISLTEYKKICDIRLRAANAKEELGCSLGSRLNDIVDIQNSMQLLDGYNIANHAYLLRVHKHLSIVEQIHCAPAVYASAVSEVVRRKEFSNAFLAWAKELSGRLSAIYNDEMERRNAFAEDLDGHFLVSLFPGMDDVPAPFATVEPPPFDASLPVLQRSEIVELSKQHPELANEFSLFHSAEPVIKFFNDCRNHIMLVTPQEITTVAATETQTLKPPDLHAHLKDYEKGFESETDTEEFEKVSQSPIDRSSTVNVQTASQINPTVILPSTIKPDMMSVETSTFNVETNNMETLTDENFESTQREITRLKSLLQQMEQRSLSSIANLRIELKEAKLEVTKTSDTYNEDITKLRATLKVLENEAKNRERELVQRLTVDHELEMNDIRKSLRLKEEEVQAVRNEKASIEAVHMDSVTQHESEKGALRDGMEKLTEELEAVRKELESLKINKKHDIAEAKEKLLKEHKAETELMRSRIRMITSVDRSPSDTSLEKIESPNMIDIASHEATISQLQADFEREKQSAIAAALELERPRHENIIDKPVQVGSPSRTNAMTSETVLRRMVDERDKRLEELRYVEAILRKENTKLKDTIAQSLSESDNGSLNVTILKEEVEKLKEHKEALEAELVKEKQRRGKLNKRYVPLNIKHCDKEDTVLVTWSPAHHQYTIYQDHPRLHVVNEHCYSEVGLTLPPANTLPTQLFALGIVIDREYCHARRANNRYRIESGAKFYRVKIARSCYALSPAVPALAATNTSRSVNTSSMEMSTTSTLTRSISESCTETTLIAEPTNALVDSCAQTDLETVIEAGDDMVDSGVVEQQKSMCRSQRTISEEIETQLDEASQVAVDPSEEAYKQNLGEDICVIGREIQTSSISSMNTSNIGLDDVDPLTDEFHSLDIKPEENL